MVTTPVVSSWPWRHPPVCLITGAAHGLGIEVAADLARRGAIVFIASRDRTAAASAAEQHKNDGDIRPLPHPLDITEPGQVAAVAALVGTEFGRLDVLINNAGTTTNVPPKDLEGLTVEEWDRVMAVNARSVFLVTRAAAPLLKPAHGCVVNTASIVGLRPGPQPLPYAASKAVVVNLTKTLALALAPEVRVNAVAPGWMEGDWMRRMLGENYEGLMARRARYTPLQRCVTPEDVAESMLSLIQANRFVTGEIVVIDGGFTSST
jgi:3-oxoacyl-[acyl-carrier protein] reductase